MFYRPIILCSLHCITETIQVIKGHKCFLQGLHVGQPWCEQYKREQCYMFAEYPCAHKKTKLRFQYLGNNI